MKKYNSDIDPVVAAIPTYKMRDATLELVHHLLDQGFEDIVVLDDCSPDNTAEAVTSEVAENAGVTCRSGEKNVGAAGIRNSIIRLLDEQNAPDSTIIAFFDADTDPQLTSLPLAERIRHVIESHPSAGLVTGDILNADGTRGAFTYGPLFSLRFPVAALLQAHLEQTSKHDRDKANRLFQKYGWILKGFPNTYDKEMKHIV